MKQYEYNLVLSSEKYGQYCYRVFFKYPKVQKMEQKSIYIHDNTQIIGSDHLIKESRQSTKNKFNFKIPFTNYFCQ